MYLMCENDSVVISFLWRYTMYLMCDSVVISFLWIHYVLNV